MIKTFISPIKLSYFADMFGFGYSLRKNIAPRDIQTLAEFKIFIFKTLLAECWCHKEGTEGEGDYIEYLQLFTQ